MATSTKTKDKKIITKAKKSPKVKSEQVLETITEQIEVKESQIKSLKKNNLKFVINLLVIILIGAGAFLLAQKYRGLVIAGTVNNQPIYRWQIISKMNDRYATSILDQMTDEALLMQQAKNNGIVITSEEIQKEYDNNIAQYGGDKAKLFEVAKQAGYTTEKSIRDLFELKLAIEKIQAKLFKVEVTADEVKKSYEQNKQYLGGKKFDEVQKDLTEQLKQQKLQTEFNNWFSKIKNEAQIKSYL